MQVRRPDQPEARRPPRGRAPRGGTGQRQTPLRIQWTGFRPLYDFWGNEIKRFYKLETLASATEYMVRTRDTFFIPSIQQVLGPAPVTSLVFELFQEGKYQLIFRLKAGNAKRKVGTFAFVAAKHPGDFSTVAAAEHKNLQILSQRAPAFVVRPFGGGKVYLPDRYHRPDKGREVYVYLTQWLTGYEELGVNEDLQFIINVKSRHTFTIDQTERLKAQMIEIIARTYDARKRDCMDLPQIASGDFVVSAPQKGEPKLKLIACRNMMHNITPAKLIQRMADAAWDWGEYELYLAPVDPNLFVKAIEKARGREEAARWFGEYMRQIRQGTFAPAAGLPIEFLEEAGF